MTSIKVKLSVWYGNKPVKGGPRTKESICYNNVGRLYLAFSFTGAKATVCNLRDIAERQVEFNVGSCPRNVFVQLQRK